LPPARSCLNSPTITIEKDFELAMRLCDCIAVEEIKKELVD
jgi:hypothetical protein